MGVRQMLARGRRENRTAWLLLGPIVLYLIIFQIIPVLAGFALGFMNWVGVFTKPTFAGFNNFVRFFEDPLYITTLWNAFYIGVIAMSVNIIIGLVGALLLNMPISGKTLIRSIWFAPTVTSTVAVAQIFLAFIDPASGVINRFIMSIGMKPIAWGYSTFWMVFWIIIYSVWRGIGSCMILWLAGLQSIDPCLYEAASMEGARGSQQFWHITLPSLRGITAYMLITSFIAALQIFEAVFFISRGGPFGTTEVIVYRIFRDFYGDFNFGMAGSGSIIITLIIIVFSLFTARWYTMKEGTNA